MVCAILHGDHLMQWFAPRLAALCQTAPPDGILMPDTDGRFTEAELETARETDLPDLLTSLGYQVLVERLSASVRYSPPLTR